MQNIKVVKANNLSLSLALQVYRLRQGVYISPSCVDFPLPKAIMGLPESHQ